MLELGTGSRQTMVRITANCHVRLSNISDHGCQNALPPVMLLRICYPDPGTNFRYPWFPDMKVMKVTFGPSFLGFTELVLFVTFVTPSRHSYPEMIVIGQTSQANGFWGGLFGEDTQKEAWSTGRKSALRNRI